MQHFAFLTKRIPSKTHIIPVYATVVFIVYGFSIYRLFWYIPGWIKFMHAGEILTTIAYVFVFDLLESLLIMAFIIALAVLFPSRLIRDRFDAQGFTIAWLLAGWAILVLNNINRLYGWSLRQFAVYVILLILAVMFSISLLVVINYRFQKFRSYLASIAERLIVFLYLYLPLSLLSLVVVVFRNLIFSLF